MSSSSLLPTSRRSSSWRVVVDVVAGGCPCDGYPTTGSGRSDGVLLSLLRPLVTITVAVVEGTPMGSTSTVCTVDGGEGKRKRRKIINRTISFEFSRAGPRVASSPITIHYRTITTAIIRLYIVTHRYNSTRASYRRRRCRGVVVAVGLGPSPKGYRNSCP